MDSSVFRGGLLAALLAFAVINFAPKACTQEGTPAQEPKKDPEAAPAGEEPKGKPAEEAEQEAPAAPAPRPAAEARAAPGFVRVPAGQVWPGCTDKEYVDRHRGNQDLKKELIYDVWGKLPDFPLPSYQIGKFEVTNAQYKTYLDKEFRVEHTTTKGETLRALAGQYVTKGSSSTSTRRACPRTGTAGAASPASPSAASTATRASPRPRPSGCPRRSS
ncbi:MAG: hypothetical protein L6Q95_01175 [Planctomycetes bacterium]|nr:hypothetical protein [Planctomycetota bacterium]